MTTKTSRIGLAPDTPLSTLFASRDALLQLRDLLMPYLARLGPPDPRAMPDMEDESVAFVNRALARASVNLNLLNHPGEVDECEFATAVKELHELKRALGLLEELVDDGLLASDGESARASAAYCKSMKTGSTGGSDPGAAA